MKAKLKVKDEFRLKKDETFTRAFPHGGYNPDGSVRDFDKAKVRAGSVATISEVHDSSEIAKGQVWYWLAFDDDVKVNVNEQQLLELFEPVASMKRTKSL